MHTSPQETLEDTQFSYYELNPQDAHLVTKVKSSKKYCVLEEKLRVVEGHVSMVSMLSIRA